MERDEYLKQQIASLQTQLKHSREEMKKLLKKMHNLENEKNDMVPLRFHENMLEAADSRAMKAEMRAATLEKELKKLKPSGCVPDASCHHGNTSTNDGSSTPTSSGYLSEPDLEPPTLPARLPEFRANTINSDYKYFGCGPNTSITFCPDDSSRYSCQTDYGEITSNFSSSWQKGDLFPICDRRLQRQKTLLIKQDSVLKTPEKAAPTKKEKQQKSFFNRMKHRISLSFKRNRNQSSIIKRVKTQFFSCKNRREMQSVYDLPEIQSLAKCTFTVEYETPMEQLNKFEATPLIFDGDESEDSGWSTSEENGEGSTQKQKCQTKSKPKRSGKKSKPKKEPPPVAPKPKSSSPPSNSNSVASGTPPSSPTNSTEKFLDDKSSTDLCLEDITTEAPQLKAPKRIQGPKGRRRPKRYSHLPTPRSSERILVS